MAPSAADPRVALVRRVLDAIHVRPTGEELDAAARTILDVLDDAHVHDNRTRITFDDETEPED